MYLSWEGRFIEATLNGLRVETRRLRLAYRHHYNPETLAREVLDCYGWHFMAAHHVDTEAGLTAMLAAAHESQELRGSYLEGLTPEELGVDVEVRR